MAARPAQVHKALVSYHQNSDGPKHHHWVLIHRPSSIFNIGVSLPTVTSPSAEEVVHDGQTCTLVGALLDVGEAPS